MEIPSKNKPFFMMMAICIGAFISHFTAGVVNVSLPYLSKIFHTNLGTVQWITIGYLLAIASFLPVMGYLGDRFGHRFIHNLGYIIFTISSVLVAFSANIFLLLILRVIQALGAAMFQATNIALITIHISKEKRGQALGIVSTAVALGAMIGPIAGGFIAEWFRWEVLFLIHVPVIMVATLLALRYIPKHKSVQKIKTFDSMEMILFVVGIASAIFGISYSRTWGLLSPNTIYTFLLSLISFVLFLLWESRHATPFLLLKLFRLPAVSYGLMISCGSFVLANIVLVAMPFYLSDIASLSPLTTGYLMIAYPVLLAVVGPLAGRLSDRYGSKPFMVIGLCSMGAGFLGSVLFLPSLSIVGVIIFLALIGLGMGLIASPNNSFIMKQVPVDFVGSIGGMIALTRNLGMVLGATLGLGLLNHTENKELDAFRSVFELGIWICLACVIIFGLGVYLEKRNKT
ncbi:MFS transporter [Shimazuella alba]|uniref:MFS transporter n=1 Tax=Shimazuella alba TaxID=2690964 RepID=A0A6I4VQI3_9BACL|nr:MFS transporter [Shimazuella alba]MXQ52535.1 MFS transporter [Shimazuella alba]